MAGALLLSGCTPQAELRAGGEVVGAWGSSTEETGVPFLVLGEDMTAVGSDGCNAISTTYTVEGDTVTLEPFLSTLKQCIGVDQWLGGVSTLTLSGDEFIVLDKQGAEIGRLPRA